MKKLLIVLFSLFLLSCKSDKQKEVKPIEIDFTKEGELFFIKNNDTITSIDIEYAETDYEQQTGLMHRSSMNMNQGMLFVYRDERPRPSFYMKNTKISLDLIYINSDSLVVEFNKNTEPYNETPIRANQPAQFVLEVNAGFIDKYALTDSIKVYFKKNNS